MSDREKRSASRIRSRLRPGKLLSEEGAFIGDCAITDRTASGARVRIFDAAALPSEMALFDERDTEQWQVELVWAAGAEAGLRFLTPPTPVEEGDAEKIAGRYYAVRP